MCLWQVLKYIDAAPPVHSVEEMSVWALLLRSLPHGGDVHFRRLVGAGVSRIRSLDAAFESRRSHGIVIGRGNERSDERTNGYTNGPSRRRVVSK